MSGRLVVADSTHVKANASRASEHLVEATEKPGAYRERLDAYEEEGLEALERRIPERNAGRKIRQNQLRLIAGIAATASAVQTRSLVI